MAKKIQYYIQSMRLRTLPLSVSGIFLGGMISVADGYWNPTVFLWAILTALSLQILSNIANELGDLQKGTDNENRLGPIRSVQSGNLTKENLYGFLIVFIVLSALFGMALVWSSFHSFVSAESLLILFMGVLAIIAAIKYTFGKKAYGYFGLGDIFVFIFFGLVSVVGVYFLMTKSFSPEIFLPASSIGFLSTAMLNQNNMRDIDNDKDFEKKTLAVRFGIDNARKYHLLIITAAFVLMLIYCILKCKSYSAYSFLLTLPIFIWHLSFVFRNTGRNLDMQMKIISMGTILFAILSGLGMILDSY